MNDYQEYVRKGASPAYDKKLALIGLVGEVGELADVVKKEAIYPDMPTTAGKILDEAGDVLWQFMNLLNQYGIGIGEVISHNIEKLNARHGVERTATDGGKRD